MEIDRFFKKYGIRPNNEQKQAILHEDGPALVLAGPGSGKTTVITARCARLVNLMESGDIKSGGILTVAFNRAAAGEMAERYKNVYNNIKPNKHQVGFSTFHSFCNSTIYRYEKIKGINYKRLGENDNGNNELCKEKILDTIYSDISGVKLTKTELKKLVNEIGRIKNGLVSDVGLSMSNFRHLDKVYETYERFKHKNNYIDFDDMLYIAMDIFQSERYILEEIHSKYRYVQADEGQDLSEIQLDILKLLSSNIFIVGDDDQGIYSFRGASPQSIVDIKKYFPGCKIYYLKKNYRSTEGIVNASSEFIKQNTVRFDKNFITDLGKGKKPKCKVFLDDSDLMAFIYARVSSKKSGKCGILYRNGASAILPSIMCCKHKLPFKISGGTGVFFNSFVTEDILDMFMEKASRKNIFLKSPNKILKEFLLEGYLKQMKEKCENLSLKYEDMLRYVCAWDFMTEGQHSIGSMVRFYEELKNTVENARSQDCSHIFLSTIHSAKGLEYDTVFIIDLYKGEFPKNCGEDELCEERRLFYVGMTRAKKYLYMMYPARRFRDNLEPSEFFKSADN